MGGKCCLIEKTEVKHAHYCDCQQPQPLSHKMKQ